MDDQSQKPQAETPPANEPVVENPASASAPASTSTPAPTEPPFPIQVEESEPNPLSPETTQSQVPPPPPSPPPPPEPAQPVDDSNSTIKKLLPLLIGLVATVLLGLLIFKVILPKFQSQEPETVNLTYWGLWEPEALVSQMIEDYRQENPHVTVQYLKQSPKDYRERLQSALARGDGPDIFRWHNTWLPMLKADLSPVPEDIYSANEFESLFYPVVKTDVFSSGNYLGIPLEFDTLVLYVNQDIFDQNPNIKVPTTWDNLRQAAFQLKLIDENTNQLTRGGIALGTTNNVDHFSDILGLMILQNGGNPGSPSQDAVVSALKFYILFANQDRSWSSALPNSTLAFATGKTAMMLAPSWRALEVKELNPQLNFKLYPAPQLPGTNITWATYWVEGVSRKSANQQEAWNFVKYLSSKEALTKFYSLAAQSRLFGEPYSRQDMTSLLQQDPYLGAVMTQAISARSWPLTSRTFDNGLNDKLIKYYEDAVNGLLQNQPEEDVIEALDSGVNQILSQYGLNTTE